MHLPSSMSGISRVLTAGSLILVVGLVATAVWMSGRRSDDSTTVFYILGGRGEISDYPSRITLGQNITIVLGIENHEGKTLAYRIQGKIGERIVYAREVPPLRDGETWEEPVQVFIPPEPEKVLLEFELYRIGDQHPHRKVNLWLER